ncbi:hypothetical protein NKI92_34225 [Mesorhizobium sp. M0323]
MTPQIADTVGVEAVVVRRSTALAVENAGDDGIGVMRCQPPQQRQRILVGTHRRRPRARQSDGEAAQRAALPAQDEMRCCLVAVDMEGDLLDECAQQLLAVARRRGGCVPDACQIGPEGDEVLPLLGRQPARTLRLAPHQFGLCRLQSAQRLLPLLLQPAGDQAIVGIDGAIAALGAVDGELRPLHIEPPLLECRLAIVFQPLGRRERGGQARRLQRLQEGCYHGFIDLHAADVEAIDASALDDDLAGAMIARCRGAPAIVGVQPSSAMATAAMP